ncbi:MAG: hypothetical protein GX322_10355 [Firmicutes bacterium]|nr:hypothetical protein [Bacillota bacterium]
MGRYNVKDGSFESTPVERYAEVSSCTWDPFLEKWHVHGHLLLEYDEDNGEEYGFVLEEGENDYMIIAEPNGPIPEPERQWLSNWAKARRQRSHRKG